MTVLNRPGEQGLVARRRTARAFAYTAVIDEAEVTARQMRRLLEGGGDRVAVLRQFHGGAVRRRRTGPDQADRPHRRGRHPVRAAVAVAVAVALLIAATGRTPGRRLPPAAGTRLLVAASVLVAAGSVFVLGVMAFTWVGQLPPVAAYGQCSATDLRAADPIPTGIAAGSILLLLPTAAWWLTSSCDAAGP